MTTNRKLLFGTLCVLFTSLVCGPTFAVSPPAEPCVVPINPDGSVDLPPEGCAYQTPEQIHVLLDGLPDGTVINVGASHGWFLCEHKQEQPCTLGGGNLGGQIETSASTVALTFDDGAGWSRSITLPADFEVHTGQVAANQTQFPTEMVQLAGAITFIDDTDFAQISISAGSAAGFHGDGFTTIIRQSNGTAEVQSNFDIGGTMHIVGTPGGRLDGVNASFDFSTLVVSQDDCD